MKLNPGRHDYNLFLRVNSSQLDLPLFDRIDLAKRFTYQANCSGSTPAKFVKNAQDTEKRKTYKQNHQSLHGSCCKVHFPIWRLLCCVQTLIWSMFYNSEHFSLAILK